MQTAITGELRHNTAPPLRVSATQTTFQFPENSDLTYIPTDTGVLVTCNHLPVAWIFSGWAGARNNPKKCTFHDVAFPALTTGQQGRITGLMLDNHSFDSLPDAVDFVERTFAYGEVSA